MKEHLENMSKFDENLKKEQERTKDALRQKLEERRRKRKQSEVDKSTAAIDETPYGQMGTGAQTLSQRASGAGVSGAGVSGAGVASLPPRIEDGGGCLAMLIYIQNVFSSILDLSTSIFSNSSIYRPLHFQSLRFFEHSSLFI